MTEKNAKDYEKDYTKPKLREQLKEEIKAGSKGGKAGQWSARKSQILVKEYEAQGGGYKHSGQKTEAQKSLSAWTEEDWQTADHKAAIRDGKTTRYLPKEVWNQLSSEEQEQTNMLKVKGSKSGKQYIDNPEEIREILKQTHIRHKK